MPVMDIREMGMPVCDRLVLVHMRMRLLAIPFAVMLVLMVLVMDVGVAVFQRFMGVFMLRPADATAARWPVGGSSKSAHTPGRA